MINVPTVEIKYLVDYDLNFTNYADFNILSDISELNTKIENIKGKKGIHLNGGSCNEKTEEVSGTLLDGTYTFYSGNENSYKGILGNELSGDDYSFKNQYIDIETKQSESYISSLIVYFDPSISVDSETSEFATLLSFSNGVNGDGTENELYNGSNLISNSSNVFMYSFGENSTLKSVRLNILKWNKTNSLMKIVKITTGYTGFYTPSTINKLSFSHNKFADENVLRFGVTQQDATLQVLDNYGIIKSLYENDLFFKNITVYIYIDNVIIGTYFLESKKGNNGSIVWDFDLKDILSFKLQEKVVPMNIEVDENGQPKSKNLNDFIRHAIQSSIPLVYDDGLEEELNNIIIPVPFLNLGQTRYDVLLKCCQIGLLRMYSDKSGNLLITRGI